MLMMLLMLTCLAMGAGRLPADTDDVVDAYVFGDEE